MDHGVLVPGSAAGSILKVPPVRELFNSKAASSSRLLSVGFHTPSWLVQLSNVAVKCITPRIRRISFMIESMIEPVKGSLKPVIRSTMPCKLTLPLIVRIDNRPRSIQCRTKTRRIARLTCRLLEFMMLLFLKPSVCWNSVVFV